MDSQQEQDTLRRTFCEDGFVYLPDFLSPEEVAQVNQQLTQLIRDKVPAMPPEHAFYEDKLDVSTLKQIQTLYTHDPYFDAMMFGSRFEALAVRLLGTGVVGKNMQYFNKPPRIGQPTPAHQDGYYFMLEPNEAVTMWLALEPVDEENGCVRYVRGSHKQGLRPHGRTQVLGFSQGMTDFGTDNDYTKEVFFPCRPGDLLVHHSLTIHRADGNQSEHRTRKALGFIYYANHAQEDVVRKQAYQQALKNTL